MSGPFVIRTPRLEILAANIEMAEAEMTGIIRLSAMLNAEFAFGWPPPENDESTMEWFFRKIFDNPEARGWLMWYFVSVETGRRIVIGSGGFLGLPDGDGVVECGYSILPPAQKNGYATEALGGLVNWAFAHKEIAAIKGCTGTHHRESFRVLEKNRFEFYGKDPLKEELTFILKRKRWQRG